MRTPKSERPEIGVFVGSGSNSTRYGLK
jgi:CspA family cold shock protein